MINCIPPDSSKKRSATSRRCVGTVPSARAPSSTYAIAWVAASPTAPPSASSARAPTWSSAAIRSHSNSRNVDTSADSSAVRASPSPFQNGIVGACPCASSTRTRPFSTRFTRHACEPRRNTSPTMLSIAKSSSTDPTTASLASSITA